MKLNTYIGLRAIAYVITDGVSIVKHGIKRVNLPFDNYYEYIAGQPVSKRINRRMKRQMRRNLWRFKSRRENLKRVFKKDFPDTEPLTLNREEALRLRVSALTEKISIRELFTVCLELQKKRGYKSLRGVSDNENSIYPKVFVSFSGGKDSTVMTELVRQVCEAEGREFISLFNDIETIAPEVNEYVESKKELFNVTILQPSAIDHGGGDLPTWEYWDLEYEALWCKPRTGEALPNFKGDWYKIFEYYSKQQAENLPYCNFVGIRGQESFIRNMTVNKVKKNNPLSWIYDYGEKARVYPLFDWRWDNVWDFLLDYNLGYNKTYDYWADAKIKLSKSRTAALYDAEESSIARWRSFFIYEKYNPDFYNKIKKRMEALGVDFEGIKNAH